MPKAFRDLQEWDATHFTEYASIPLHMLDFIDFKSPDLIENMSATFNVSEKLCVYRLNHIHRNIQFNLNDQYNKGGVKIG